MKEIPLTQEQVALVDDDDFEKLNQFKWHVHPYGQTYYARRHPHVYMHHQIMGKPPIGLVTDHKDRNGLHNWKDNLRFITQRKNTQYPNVTKSSIYPGVSRIKGSNKWLATIWVNGKNKRLGSFFDELKAAETYQRAFIEMEAKGNIHRAARTMARGGINANTT